MVMRIFLHIELRLLRIYTYNTYTNNQRPTSKCKIELLINTLLNHPRNLPITLKIIDKKP